MSRRNGTAPASSPDRTGIAGDLRMRLIQIVVGLTCALAFLAIALYRVPLAAVASSLARTSPFWLAAGFAAYMLDLAVRAWRWRLILQPVARLRYLTVARVLVVGYGLNTIMPLRLGELFRAEFLKKTAGVRRVPALASIVVERTLDGLAVVFCLGLGLLLAARSRPPSPLMIDALAVGGAVFGAALVVVLCAGEARAAAPFARLPRLQGVILAAGDGLAILRTRRTVPIVLMTVIVYLADALPIWCVVRALGLPLSGADTLVLLGIASLGTLLPSGPGFLGTLQLAYILGIEFAGGAGAVGAAAATLVQVALLLPVAIMATGILIHGSGSVLRAALARQELEPV